MPLVQHKTHTKQKHNFLYQIEVEHVLTAHSKAHQLADECQQGAMQRRGARRTTRRHKTVLIRADAAARIRRRHEQRQRVALQLATHVRQQISKQTTGIGTAF
jgi:hypothetical protein